MPVRTKDLSPKIYEVNEAECGSVYRRLCNLPDRSRWVRLRERPWPRIGNPRIGTIRSCGVVSVFAKNKTRFLKVAVYGYLTPESRCPTCTSV